MFGWLNNLFNDPEHEAKMTELDARIAAIDTRIAAKEVYLKEISEDVLIKRETVQRLKKIVNRESN